MVALTVPSPSRAPHWVGSAQSWRGAAHGAGWCRAGLGVAVSAGTLIPAWGDPSWPHLHPSQELFPPHPKLLHQRTLNPKPSARPFVPADAIIPGVHLSSGLSAAVIPPGISRVALIMLVPFFQPSLSLSSSKLGAGARHRCCFSEAPLFSLLRY